MYKKVSNLKPAYPTNEAWYNTKICKSVCSHGVLSMVGRSRCWEKLNGRGVVSETPLVQMMSNNILSLIPRPSVPRPVRSWHGGSEDETNKYLAKTSNYVGQKQSQLLPPSSFPEQRMWFFLRNSTPVWKGKEDTRFCRSGMDMSSSCLSHFVSSRFIFSPCISLSLLMSATCLLGWAWTSLTLVWLHCACVCVCLLRLTTYCKFQINKHLQRVRSAWATVRV